ncbi:MAG: DUF4123 domain-containing protein [Sulfurovum sp.]|nr:DUF4123 domain-containing protein [Sulfurovum sp.]
MKIFNPEHIKEQEYHFDTYCVLDGVKYSMLWSDLEDGSLEYDVLFKEEKLRTELERVAPFLVKLDFINESGIAQSEELMKCYGKNGGIFFTSPLAFSGALEKMREIFYLYTEEGEVEGVLRFYEPIVFLELIKESSLEVQRDIFAKIYCYWCEDETHNRLMKFMWDQSHVRYQTIILDEKVEINNEAV